CRRRPRTVPVRTARARKTRSSRQLLCRPRTAPKHPARGRRRTSGRCRHASRQRRRPREAARRKTRASAPPSSIAVHALGGAGQSEGRALVPARELERDDPRPPRTEDEIAVEVLLRVPERAVVAGIDREIAVVAPASLDLRLRPCSRERHLL